MPRPRNPIRPRRYDVYVPEPIAARIDMLLYSTAEQRIPKGAISEFFTALAEQALARAASTTPVTPERTTP